MRTARTIWQLLALAAALGGILMALRGLGLDVGTDGGVGAGISDSEELRLAKLGAGLGILAAALAILLRPDARPSRRLAIWCAAAVLLCLTLVAAGAGPAASPYAPGGALVTALLASMALRDKGNWPTALLGSLIAAAGVLRVADPGVGPETGWYGWFERIPRPAGLCAALLGIASLCRSIMAAPAEHRRSGPLWLPVATFIVLAAASLALTLWSIEEDAKVRRQSAAAQANLFRHLLEQSWRHGEEQLGGLAERIAEMPIDAPWGEPLLQEFARVGLSSVSRYAVDGSGEWLARWTETPSAGIPGEGDALRQHVAWFARGRLEPAALHVNLQNGEPGVAMIFGVQTSADGRPQVVAFVRSLKRFCQEALPQTATRSDIPAEVWAGQHRVYPASDGVASLSPPFEEAVTSVMPPRLGIRTEVEAATPLRDVSPRTAGILASFLVVATVSASVALLQQEMRRKFEAERIRRRTEDLIDAAPMVAVMSVDESGCLVQFNRAAESITGYQASDALTRPITMLLHDDEIASLEGELRSGESLPGHFIECLLAEGWQTAGGSERHPKRPWRIRCSNGERRFMHLASSVWTSDGGSKPGHLVVGVEVTREVELLDRQASLLRDADAGRKAAELARQNMKELLKKVSHEVKNPLTAILAAGELVRSGREDPEDAARHIDTILLESERLNRQATDLLDQKYIEEGVVPVHPRPLVVAHALGELRSLVAPLAERRGLALRTELHGDAAIECMVDKDRLLQILRNLAENAIKVTERGSVTLTLRQEAKRGRCSVQVDVTDTGPGIGVARLAEIQSLAEQPVQQLQSSLGGHGLGLPISFGMARAIGATLTVRTAIGTGSTFTLTLTAPLATEGDRAADPVSGEEERRPAGDRPLEGVRILIAEDEEAVRRLVLHVLRRAGADARAEPDGDVAVECERRARLGGQPYALILMDLHMARIGGLDAARLMRESGCTAPILALTAVRPTIEQERELSRAFREIIQKPIQPLQGLVSACLRHARPPDASAA